MIKMYMAEVLSKFPVVQHFPFGGLFQWVLDPNAASLTPSAHVTSQPTKTHIRKLQDCAARQKTQEMSSSPSSGARASWTNARPAAANTTTTPVMPATRAPWASADGKDSSTMHKPLSGNDHQQPTRAPWNYSSPIQGQDATSERTKAPWAKD